MPIVLRIGNYKFFFYSNEGTPLKGCHVHVRSTSGEAKIYLLPEVRIISNVGFNAQELREIYKIIKEKQDFLIGAWNDYFTS
jgi:hypothetical protein